VSGLNDLLLNPVTANPLAPVVVILSVISLVLFKNDFSTFGVMPVISYSFMKWLPVSLFFSENGDISLLT
jgi:hypothetical protein